jgi:hypothetical protein
MWRQIDEQPISSHVRRLLMLNGFRTGLVGGNVPESLARLLQLVDTPPQPADRLQPVRIESDPVVTLRRKQIRSGETMQVLVSDLYDELPLLWHTGDHLAGRTLAQAQCILALTAEAEKDGHVRLRLVPEVHHDQPKREYRGSEGQLRIDIARPKQSFEELAVDVHLAVGQMIVIGGLDDHPGSMGHCFLARQTPQGPERKIIVVRLASPPPQPWFDDD